ncbi:MAG: exopolysaccharide biosynthesis protein [Candidatus Thiodiazotropha sp.]
MNRSSSHRPPEPNWRQRLLHRAVYGSGLSPAQRWAAYLGVLMAALMMTWLPIGLFVALIPVSYSSKWDLILPGSGSGLAVSLESVGQASANAASPYTSHSIDPKVNYKALAENASVLQAAAAELGMSMAEFGKPRIKLVDQTALMHFRISASSAQLAQRKSQALYKALQRELERLRADEAQQRENAVNLMLESYNENLRTTQQRILDYQSRSRIVSLEQFTELTMNLERSRTELGRLQAEHASIEGRLNSLVQLLGTTPQEAATIHMLQQDALFQQLATQWSTAVTKMSEYRNQWGKKHPAVIEARDNHDKLRSQLRQRLSTLGPESQLTTDRLIALSSGNAVLFTQMVELASSEQGMRQQIATLKQNISAQSRVLEESTTDASTLEDLKRKHQVATAVLTTALAKLDIGKSDHFSAYPLLQLLTSPTLPEKPDNLARNLALAGGLGATLFVFIGLLLLWNRKPYLRKLAKNA